jgi:hypothetical protein
MKSQRNLVVILVLLFSVQAYSQFTNVRISDPLSTSPEEVTIAINPTNLQNMIAGANLRFYYSSTNSGQSWAQRQLPPGTYGDPCVMFDVNGRAYYAHLADMRNRGGYWLDRLAVHRSSDGGSTWFDSLTTPVNPPKQQDKEWLACDFTSSPYRNNIYMAWTEFDIYGSLSTLDSTRILFSKIVSGSNSWTAPIRVSDEGGNCIDEDSTVEGAVPSVGPNGEVYLAWAGPKGIMFDRSFNGGSTFGKDIFVSTMPGGWDYGIPGIYRCNGLPMTACDISSSAYRGTVYILWGDQRNGDNNTDVFIVKSTDQGVTWTSPKRVNADGGSSHQFFPSFAIDQSNGNLYVVFYDRRAYTSSDNSTDVFLARSIDGGETWSDGKISQVPFLPTSGVFFGDYIQIAASQGIVRPIWMRLDATSLSVWTALISDTSNGSSNQPVEFSISQNFPNPFRHQTRIDFYIAIPAATTLRVFDIFGREIATLVQSELGVGKHTAYFYADNFSSGVYFYRIRAGSFTKTERMLLLK